MVIHMLLRYLFLKHDSSLVGIKNIILKIWQMWHWICHTILIKF
jgi:hypothetical protein